MSIKKGDTVLVLSGKDKGKQGKVLEAMPKKDKVVVEGINEVKRHTKPNGANPQGGIITKPAPMYSCKLQVVCPACKKATRVKNIVVAGKSVRACKHCGEVIDKEK